MPHSDVVKRLRIEYPTRVPCIVNFEGKEMKFMVPRDTTGGAFLVCMRAQLKKRKYLPQNAEKALFIFHENKLLPNTMPLSDLDTDKSKTLHFVIQLENTFG